MALMGWYAQVRPVLSERLLEMPLLTKCWKKVEKAFWAVASRVPASRRASGSLPASAYMAYDIASRLRPLSGSRKVKTFSERSSCHGYSPSSTSKSLRAEACSRDVRKRIP